MGFLRKHVNKSLLEVSEAATRDVLLKKGVLKNFLKSAGKHLCQSLFFNKVADLRPATYLKIDPGAYPPRQSA